MKKTLKAVIALLTAGVVAVAVIFAVRQLPGFAKSETSDVQPQSSFYYDRLTQEQRDIYDVMLPAVKSGSAEIRFRASSVDDIKKAFRALSYDNPSLINVSNMFTVGYSAFGFVKIKPSYRFSLQEYVSFSGELEAKVNEIIESMPQGFGEYEKELFIHDWLIDNCAYKTAQEEYGIEHTAYGAIINGEANCEGYSRAAQLLMYACGVDNYVVSGQAVNESGSQNHMWNIVKVDGEWYNADITWDDPVSNGGEGVPNHFYFNLTDAEISKTHMIDITDKNPCVSDKANYFVRSGRMFEVYDSQTKAAIAKLMADCANAGCVSAEFRFANADEYDRAVYDMFKLGKLNRILVAANLLIDGEKLSTTKFVYTGTEELCVLSIIFQR